MSQLSTLNNILFHQLKYVESTQYKEIIDNNIENFKYSLNYQDHTHILLQRNVKSQKSKKKKSSDKLHFKVGDFKLNLIILRISNFKTIIN